MSGLSLTLNFMNEDELISFLEDFRRFRNKEILKMFKSKRDNSHIKEIHKKAKEYAEINNIEYREAYKIICRNQNNNLNSNSL